MPASTLRGRFVWHELMTTDPDAAVGFYSTVAGWKVQARENDPSYRLWTMGGVPMGGLMRLPDDARRMDAPPNWLVYVGVPDVDATVRQASSLGSRTLVAPRDLPVGRFAVLADPQGATFAVYRPSPSQEPKPSDEITLGDFSWHELASTDYKAAWEFYRALFGWDHRDSLDMGPAGVYWMYGLAGGKQPLGGMYTKPPEMPAPPHWLCYVRVPSADWAAAAVGRLGGRVLNGPMEVPGGGRIAMCVDPQGAAFAVHSLAAAKPPVKRKPAKPKKAKQPGKKSKKVAAKQNKKKAKPQKRAARGKRRR